MKLTIGGIKVLTDLYVNAERCGYAFLPQGATRSMMYECFDQPEICLRNMRGKCNHPTTDCINCPCRKVM